MFSLYVNNFRCFVNERFDFSKINILIGENNSGKSSLLKFLVALKQSYSNPRELNLTLSGEGVDLGNYKEVVYYHDIDKQITFGFDTGDDYGAFFSSFALSNPSMFGDDPGAILLRSSFSPKVTVSYTMNQNLAEHANIKTSISSEMLGTISLFPSDKPDQCSLLFESVSAGQAFKFDNLEFEKDAFSTLVRGPGLSKRCSVEANGDRLFSEMAYLLVAQNYVKEELSKMQFVNPISKKPERFYLRKDKKKGIWINNIEELVQIMDDLPPEAIKQFSEVIAGFGIVDEVQLRNENELPVMELRARVRDLWSNITDVGYGVSLQLPIIFSAFMANLMEGGTILIEQPEVHLHPKLQAQFIDTLLQFRQNSYFIETHSEHIIRRLQVLVREKKHGLKESDVRIHYLARGATTSQKTAHLIDSNGKLSPNFPSGFYDVSYELAKELLD